MADVPDLEEELINRINEIMSEGGWNLTGQTRPPKPSTLDMLLSPPDPNSVRRFTFTYQTPGGNVKATVKARANAVDFELSGPFGKREKRFKVTRYAYLDHTKKFVRFKNKEDLVGEVHLLMIYFSPVTNLKLTPKQMQKIRMERMQNPMVPPPVGLPPQILERIMTMPMQQGPQGPLPPLDFPPMMQGMAPGTQPGPMGPVLPGMQPSPMGPVPPGMQPGQFPPQGQMQPPIQQQVPMPGPQPAPTSPIQMPNQPGQGPQPQVQSPSQPPAPKLTECPQCGSPLGDPNPDGTYSCQFCGAIIEP